MTLGDDYIELRARLQVKKKSGMFRHMLFALWVSVDILRGHYAVFNVFGGIIIVSVDDIIEETPFLPRLHVDNTSHSISTPIKDEEQLRITGARRIDFIDHQMTDIGLFHGLDIRNQPVMVADISLAWMTSGSN